MLVVSLASIGSAPRADAYSFWACPQAFPNVQLDTSGVSSGYAAAAILAAAAWNYPGSPIHLSGNNPTSPNSMGDSYFGASGYVGITYNSGCVSTPAGVFTTGMSAYWNTYYTNSYSTDARQSTMVHELGHLMGLGHDTRPLSCGGLGSGIMYPNMDIYFVCGIKTPQFDDHFGMTALY